MARVSRHVAEVGESAAQRAFNLLHMRVVRISRATEQETRMTRRFAFAALACTALSAPAFAQDAPSAAEAAQDGGAIVVTAAKSEEHTSELQSLMRNSYAVFCL